MTPLQPIPAPELPARKGLSKTDVQALGLMLLILMVINLPLYKSVLKDPGQQTPRQVAAVRPAPIKTAFAGTLSPDVFKPGVSSPTTTSGASNNNPAH